VARLGILVQGELDRLKKYNLFTATFVVTLSWIGVAWFVEAEFLKSFVPLILLMDTTMMTILLVGATLFYEKKEHTMNSIMVSPVTVNEYLASKVVVSVINSLLTLVTVSAAVYFLKGVTFNYLLFFPAVILVSAAHTVIGILLSYFAKDFTSMLVNYIIYVFVFMLPSILILLGVIDETVGKFLFILPPESANILISAAAREVEAWRIIAGYVYLSLLSLGIYRFIVRPKFMGYVMKETGV
jgi:fluoroquinolone transport system permease protein